MKKKKENYSGNKLKVGVNIRKWRNIKDVKQKELAGAMQLSEAAISNIENDLTDVTLSQLEEISSTLDITVEQLLSDPQESFIAGPLASPHLPGYGVNAMDKELLNAMLASMRKKDEQLQAIMENVLNTMSALIQDEKKFA